MSDWINGPPQGPGYYWAYYEDIFALTNNSKGYIPFKLLVHIQEISVSALTSLDEQPFYTLWLTTTPCKEEALYYPLSSYPDLIKHIKIEEPTI